MAAAAWAGPSLLRAAGEETRRRLSWEFRPADGEPAGLAPPGLTVAENPTLRLDIEAVEPASKTILEPESWGWARLSVKTRFQRARVAGRARAMWAAGGPGEGVCYGRKRPLKGRHRTAWRADDGA
jgi:hypothetical protein